MAVVTWGELAKTVGDLTTILDEINTKIGAHNVDESAHSQSNEAIWNHRIGEILDHLDGSVTTLKIRDLAVETAKIKALAVTTAKIANLAVEEGKIKDLAVATAKIQALAVDTARIKALAVTTAKIADLAVDSAKIKDLAVETAKIKDLSVETIKIKDGAVLLEKLASTKRIIISVFESLDGWLTDGTVISDFGSLTLRAGNVINTYTYSAAFPSGILGLNWAKDFFWQSTARVAQITNQVIYFGVGGSEYLGGYSGAGFKILNGTLYCYHWDLVEEAEVYVLQEISGITLTDAHVYRMIYDQSAGTLKFYIDGVLKHTFSSGLPTDDSDELTLFELKTTEASYKYFYAFDLLVSVER